MNDSIAGDNISFGVFALFTINPLELILKVNTPPSSLVTFMSFLKLAEEIFPATI